MKNAGYILAVALLISFMGPGCRTLSRPDSSSPVAPKTERLLEGLNRLGGEIRTVQADGKLEYYKGKRHERVELSFLLKKPNQAVLELTGPTGMLSATSLDGREFRHYDLRKRRMLVGPARENSLKNVLPVSLPPQELVPLLSGTPILLNGDRGGLVRDEKTKRWRLLVRSGDGCWIQALWFENNGDLYRMRLMDADKNARFEVTYLGWKSRGKDALRYPGFIKLVLPSEEVKLTLRIHDDAVLNEEIADDLFRLPFPKGVPVQALPSE